MWDNAEALSELPEWWGEAGEGELCGDPLRPNVVFQPSSSPGASPECTQLASCFCFQGTSAQDMQERSLDSECGYFLENKSFFGGVANH
jgi:hypothetical protein